MKDNLEETGQSVKELQPVFCFRTNSNQNQTSLYPAFFYPKPFKFSKPENFYPYVINGAVMGFVK